LKELPGMAAIVVDRCFRCATKIRNGRKICPSCGLDLNAPIEQPQAGVVVAESSPSAQSIKKVSAKQGVKMCMICMQSIAEDLLIEQDGQKICPDCGESMKKKGAKKPPAPPK
jgi:hypothetical protein